MAVWLDEGLGGLKQGGVDVVVAAMVDRADGGAGGEDTFHAYFDIRVVPDGGDVGAAGDVEAGFG